MKFLEILIISIVVCIVLLSSLNEANALHKATGTNTIAELKEESFFESIDVENLRAFGLAAECKVTGEETLLVPNERCVFEIESLRYIPKDPGAFGKNIFALICVDNFDPDFRKINNCFIPAQGTVGIGGAFSIGPNFGADTQVGEVVSGGALALSSVTLDLGFSVPMTQVQTKLAQGDFRAKRMGGNILVDSGIGSIVAHEYVGIAHDPFTGSIEIFGKKPVKMKLTFGTVGPDKIVKCGKTSPAECDKNVFGLFVNALEYLCFDCAVTSGISSNAASLNAAAVSGPGELLDSDLPISRAELISLIESREDEIREFAKTTFLAGLELDLNEFLETLSDIDTSGINEKIDEEFKELLMNVETLFDSVLAKCEIDHPDLCEDLSDILEKLEPIIEKLDDIEFIESAIEDIEQMFKDIDKVAGDIENIKKNIDDVTTLQLPLCTIITLIKTITCIPATDNNSRFNRSGLVTTEKTT